MKRRPVRSRQTGAYPSKLSIALVLSVMIHVALFVVPLTLIYLLQRDPPAVFQVQLVQGAETGALRPDQAAPNPSDKPRPEDKPKGTPDAVPDPEKPKEEPKPKEKPPEKPPVEKPKEEPKPKEKPKEEPKEEPKPEEKPKEEPKPEEKPKEEPKPKEKPKEEPKPKEKPKEEPKPKEKPKEEPKPKKKPVVLDDPDITPADEEMEDMEALDSVEPVDTGPVGVEDGMEGLEEIQIAKNVGELTQGSAVEAADFPDALSYWATLVKRKVDRAWHGKVPAGLSLDAAEVKVRVGFWVNRNGEVLEDPVVVDGSFNTTLRASCVQAIKDALPLPPFPDTFTESEQYITYVFTLAR